MDKKHARTLKSFVFIIATAWAIGVGVRSFLVSIHLVEGDSMSPALHNGDLVLVNVWSKNFAPGDIVVFDVSKSPRVRLVKRIVGPPNSTIYVDNYKLFLNRKPAFDGPGYEPVWNKDAFECRYSDVLKSGADEFVVLGDNRCNSSDSRSFGSISRKDILGKVFYKIKIKRPLF